MKIAYLPTLVRHDCAAISLPALINQELRWGRTIRMLNPAGYWGSLITFPLPLAVFGAVLLHFSVVASAVLALAMVTRIALKRSVDRIVPSAGPIWLLPLRDMLAFAVYIASLWGRSVEWQGRRLQVRRGGVLSRP